MALTRVRYSHAATMATRMASCHASTRQRSALTPGAPGIPRRGRARSRRTRAGIPRSRDLDHVARARKLDVVDELDGSRPPRHHHHPVGQGDGLGEVVGHEDDGLMLGLPSPPSMVVEAPPPTHSTWSLTAFLRLLFSSTGRTSGAAQAAGDGTNILRGRSPSARRPRHRPECPGGDDAPWSGRSGRPRGKPVQGPCAQTILASAMVPSASSRYRW